MILTVTINPSVDISYRLNALKLDDVNRVTHYSKTPGGKGLNVARVLTHFNERPSATGFLGGALGQFISTQLSEIGIKDYFFQTEKETRNCIALLHDEGKQTEILESGPVIDNKESQAFLDHFSKLLKGIEIVTISGSLPRGLPSDYYVELIRLSNLKGKRVILDSSGGSLKEVLHSEEKPFAIKPNIDELENILNEPLENDDSIMECLNNKLFNGIDCILVSKGANGAFVKWNSDYFTVTIPKVKAVNPVGSGDATVAGLAKSLKDHLEPEKCITTAMTSGILNALNEKTGEINLLDYTTIYEKIKVSKL